MRYNGKVSPVVHNTMINFVLNGQRKVTIVDKGESNEMRRRLGDKSMTKQKKMLSSHHEATQPFLGYELTFDTTTAHSLL